jgi:hypothetical protein
MTIKPLFKWYDLWVGVFVARPDDRGHGWRVFILPAPCVGVVVEFDGRSRAWARARWRASRVRRWWRPPCPTCGDARYVWVNDHVGRNGYLTAHTEPCPTCRVPEVNRIMASTRRRRWST